MEDILARVVAPLPTYETRDKYPPPPESNSLEFMHFYAGLEKEEKLGFLTKLSHDFGVDHKGISELALRLLDAQLRDLATILQVEDRLRYGLTPRYKQLLNHISRVEGGVKFLVDLRADVLEMISSKASETPQIRVIDLFTISTDARVCQSSGVRVWRFGMASLKTADPQCSSYLKDDICAIFNSELSIAAYTTHASLTHLFLSSGSRFLPTCRNDLCSRFPS